MSHVTNETDENSTDYSCIIVTIGKSIVFQVSVDICTWFFKKQVCLFLTHIQIEGLWTKIGTDFGRKIIKS